MSQTNQHATTPSNTEEKRYFNEYARGLGYLNSVRDFGTAQKPRLAAQISALQGPSDQVEYVYHDLVVSSEKVLKVINDHKEAIDNDDAKVLIHFKMANPKPNPFIYKNGERAGELGASIGGFLTGLLFMKVNGVLVYEGEQGDDNQASE